MFSAIVLCSAALTGAAALWTLGRWQLGLPPLVDAYRDLPPIQPLTALCLALWSIALGAAQQQMRLLVSLACLVVIAIAGFRLYQAGVGRDFGLDRLLFPNAFADGAEHLRVRCGMTVATAITLFCLSGAVAGRPYAPRLTLALLSIPACVSGLSVIALVLGVDGPGGVTGFASMALAASVGGLIAVTGSLCLEPQPLWVMGLFGDDGPARRARRALPWAIILPAGAAWVAQASARAGHFSGGYALALVTTACVALLALAVIWGALGGREAASPHKPEPSREADLVAERLPSPPAEAGSEALAASELAPQSPVTLVRHALDLFQPQAAGRGIELSLAFDDLPPRVLLNAPRLREILLNLLGDAMTLTPGGEIQVRCAYDPVSETMTFAVSASGLGIDADQALARLRRVAEDDAAGAGLRIARELVEAMGGEIWLTKSDGGAVLGFSLPAALAAPQEHLHPTA